MLKKDWFINSKAWLARLAGIVLIAMPVHASADYSAHSNAAAFIDMVVEKHELNRDWVSTLLTDAERKESILEAISRPAEKALVWHEYADIFLTESRLKGGLAFWQKHRETLARAEARFGVPAQVIVAIIGVETRYGGNMGSYRVLDALATLGFDYPKRSAFFLGQLEQFLLLVREQGFDPMNLKGSYAGAMGFGQFIPSSYRHYAIDFDDDGVVDILSNPVDAIGSVANYFAKHGWRQDQAVAVPAVMLRAAPREWLNDGLKPERSIRDLREAGFAPRDPLDYDGPANVMRFRFEDSDAIWLGLHNFYVITRYNHSRLYGMAVYQLSEQLKDGML